MKLCELTGEILTSSKPIIKVSVGFLDEDGHFFEDECVIALKERSSSELVGMCLEKHERKGIGELI
tara:strand:+ start:4120 stop:4317 length:198 start_codon:yes stop_codon:yes gene_type:complete